MRVVISGLVLALAGLWPQCALGEVEASQSPVCGPWSFKERCDGAPFVLAEYESKLPFVQPMGMFSPDDPIILRAWNQHWPFAHPLASRIGPFSLPTFNCLQGDDRWATKDEFLVFVVVQGANIELTTNRVELLAEDKVKAETHILGELAVFSVKGDVLEQPLTVRIIPWEVDYYNLSGGDFGFSLSHKMIIAPDAVDVLVLPRSKSNAADLPGIHGKLVSTSKESPVFQHLHLNVALRQKTSFENMMDSLDETEYATRTFSLKSDPVRPRPRSTSNLKLLGETQNPAITDIDIQPVDWRKGQAGASLNLGLCAESRLLFSVDGKKPEVIIIRTYPEPKTPEPVKAFEYLHGMSIGGVGLTF